MKLTVEIRPTEVEVDKAYIIYDIQSECSLVIIYTLYCMNYNILLKYNDMCT